MTEPSMIASAAAVLVAACLSLAQADGAPPATAAADAQREKVKQDLLRQLQEGKDPTGVLWKLYGERFEDTYGLFYQTFHQSKDPKVRTAALMLMWRRNMPNLDRAVIEALQDPDGEVRRAALEYLPAAKDAGAIVAAISAALRSMNTEERWLGARALASCTGALKHLPAEARRAATDDDPIICQAFLANVAPGEGVEELAVPILIDAVQWKSPMTRMSAAESLRRLGAFAGKLTPQRQEQFRGVLSGVLADLGDPIPSVAGAATFVAMELWSPVVEARVREALKGENLMLRARAADVLRKKKAAFDPAALLDVVRRGEQNAQLFAVGTLTRVQTPACVPVLQAALAGPHASVRQAAVYALEVVEHPTAVRALIDALGHADANVRNRAAKVLGRRGAAEALTVLREHARTDDDAEVRRSSAVAAALVAQEDLAGVLVDPREFARQAAKLPARKCAPTGGKPTPVVGGIVQVGSQKQLFVDDLVVADPGRAVRLLHRFTKDPRNPVLEQQFPWEIRGAVCYCTTVHYDGDKRLFSFWYTSLGKIANKGEAIRSRAQLLALSADGVHWVRPNLGAYEFGGSKVNNLVGCASNIVVMPDSPDPARRYASYIWHPQFNALSVSFSPDGVRDWSPYARVCGGGKDVVTACRDPLGGGYFSFMKWRVGRWYRRSAWAAWGQTPTAMTRGPINIIADFDDDRGSADRIAEAIPGLDFVQPSRFHTEIYQVTPLIYEGVYFGLPVRFDVSGPGAGNVDGPTDICLIASRDKRGEGGWLRPDRTGPWPVLSGGPWGQWDSTQLYGPSNVLVIDDQIVLYYCAGPFGHEPEGSRSDAAGKNVYRMAIGRATLRLDRMVSLSAGLDEAVVTTKPLVFQGSQLVVNFDCRHDLLAVAVLGRSGKAPAAPGLDLSDCDLFTGDELRHVVSWKGRTDLSHLAGKPIRLLFLLRRAHLYSFQFVEGGKATKASKTTKITKSAS